MTNEVKNIWTRFHKELKGFIISKVKNSNDADDILQDVFAKIIQHTDKVNQAKNLQQYLYGMVRNAVSDHFRKRTFPTDDLEVQETEPFTATEVQSLNATIAECCLKPFINKLPESYKEALLITEFQNTSQKELAKKLNISYSGAKSRVQRGKEKLKELLLSCCAYESDIYGNLIDKNETNCNCSS